MDSVYALQDDTQVTLQAVYAQAVVGDWVFVRTLNTDNQLLPVYTKAPVSAVWSLEISGRMATSFGQRYLIADRVRLYSTFTGDPAPPMPPLFFTDTPYPYMVELTPEESLIQANTFASTNNILGNKSISSLTPPIIPSPSSGSPAPALSAPAGSIAAAKIDGGSVTLSGKVVTAVFYVPGTETVQSFYVQEPVMGGNGIMVFPCTSVSVDAGDTVTISGTVAGGAGLPECYVNATAVTNTSTANVPQAVGMGQKMAAGGAFGLQQSLYKVAPDAGLSRVAVNGCGLNPVGSRVRLWGKVTAIDGKSCWIDDGPGLKSTFGIERAGIRVIFEGTCPYSVGSYATVTGILGADASWDANNMCAVPVLRVPGSDEISISLPSNSIIHKSSTATVVQLHGLAKSPAYGIQAVQVAVAPGLNASEPTTWTDATYNHATHEWTYNWSSASAGDYTVWAKATDRAGISVETHRDLTVTDANVIYVSASSSGGLGTSWDTAKKTVEGGLSAANPGDEIWVKAGTYKASDELIMKNGVALYGGFAGDETFREQRNIAANETILDGSGAHRVIRISSCTDTAVDGFTIQNGYINDFGGGIICSDSYATIANNKFLGNNSLYGGGAINCSSSTTLIVNNKIGFKENGNSGFGEAAIYIFECNAGSVVSDNDIEFTKWTKAAVCCFYTDIDISNNTISHNCCGGIYTSNPPGLVSHIHDNIIYDNTGYGIDHFCGNLQVINNTIVKNTYGICIYVDVDPALIANNILAFNGTGITYSNSSDTITADYNCVFGNGTTSYDQSAGAHDKNLDPGFLDLPAGNLHILPSSPCVDVGDSTCVETGWTDMDGEQRVPGTVDIGADEFNSSYSWYKLGLVATPSRKPIGDTIVVTQSVVDNTTQAAIPGQRVNITLDSGSIESVTRNGVVYTLPGGTQSTYGITGDDGKVVVNVTRSTRGIVNVTSCTAQSSRGYDLVEQTTHIYFYGPSKQVDIFFCIDCTWRMGQGEDYEINYRPHESIKALIDDLTNLGITLRLGGVKFDDGEADYEYGYFISEQILEGQKRSISMFTTVEDYSSTSWLYNGYSPGGGDGIELQLDALNYAAQDMNANATSPNKFIVLVTDSPYHYMGDGHANCSAVTKNNAQQALVDSGCAVFLSLWELSPWHSIGDLYDPTSQTDKPYNELAVNGGAVDTPNYDGDDAKGIWKYPFTALRARILTD